MDAPLLDTATKPVIVQTIMSKGTIYIIAAASGTGKTSLVSMLLESLDNISISVSHTTREMRPGEQNGENYFFVNQATFKQMMKNGEFLEHAEVFGNYYGTSKQWLDQQLEHGTDVILEIDWQGALQVMELYPESVSIFILPPSLAELRDRLEKRNLDQPAIIEKRLAAAHEEIPNCSKFDYIIVNDKFDVALVNLRSIIRAHRLRRQTQLNIQHKLLAELTKNQ